jgi:CubicO group peptidase (beta-lactamase class C family)
MVSSLRTDEFSDDRGLNGYEEHTLVLAGDPLHRFGDVDGIWFVSPGRLREATTVAISGVDEVFGMPSTWALGYSIGRPGSDRQDSASVFGIGGVGGSFAYGDTASGIAFALTKNRSPLTSTPWPSSARSSARLRGSADTDSMCKGESRWEGSS